MVRTNPLRMRWGDPAYLLALGFGTGLSPKAPGTVASAVAALIYWAALGSLSLAIQGAIIGLGFVLGVMAIPRIERESASHDHGSIVWDEFIGVWIALLAAGPAPLEIITGFALFRLFDIWKPWPVSWADKHVRGGLGVMLDDVLAGILSAATLLVLNQAGLGKLLT